MHPLAHARTAALHVKRQLISRILSHRVQVRHPTLICHPTAIWDYGYRDLDAIELGDQVSVGAFVEIVVQKRNRHTPLEGRLVMGDRSVVSAGANIRAAGGTIAIGAGSGIGQHSMVVAANHKIKPGTGYFHTPYDETRSGVTIGSNVWVGAHCVILPGVTIGDDAVIAASSVVTTDVPAGEIWAGAPARRQATVAAFGRFAR
jgi:acetyltransferase-like isoleucine patch superfamily enzyme